MSALGQKQTFVPQKAMSALPPIADMCGAKSDVRLVPIADIALSVEMKEAANGGGPFFYATVPIAVSM